MFSRRGKRILAAWFGLMALIAIVTVVAGVRYYRASRDLPAESGARQPTTITTSSGNGTTATYQTEETQTASPSPATVYIIEPDGDGRAEETGTDCLDARKIEFWVAPQVENKNLVRLMWNAPGALRVEVEGHGTEVTRGSMLVDLTRRKPDDTDKQGHPEYTFSFVAQKGRCRAVESKTTFLQFR